MPSWHQEPFYFAGDNPQAINCDGNLEVGRCWEWGRAHANRRAVAARRAVAGAPTATAHSRHGSQALRQPRQPRAQQPSANAGSDSCSDGEQLPAQQTTRSGRELLCVLQVYLQIASRQLVKRNQTDLLVRPPRGERAQPHISAVADGDKARSVTCRS